MFLVLLEGFEDVQCADENITVNQIASKLGVQLFDIDLLGV